MARYTAGRRTVTEVFWKLDLPTNGVEIDKAIQAAARAYKDTHFGYEYVSEIPDDALTITAEDDVLVISFTVKEEL